MFFTYKPTLIAKDHSSQRVTIRSVGATDARIVCEYFVRNKAFLKPWDPIRDNAFYTVSGWKYKITRLAELEKLRQGLYLLILNAKETRVLGVITFSNIVGYPFHSCNLGYSLDEEEQGNGLMHSSLTQACEFMFSKYNMHRIQASYLPRNQRSARVLQRMGFAKEGVAKDYLLIDGRWQDHVLTSLTNQHWTAACKD
ncbi:MULTISPECIES: ribosomal protein S5-alanine N-acetyltransferase [Vibrio]|uniref:Ribosomal-protein-alanine acetyltransferase RimJ n=1 Tax=Vibrio halioticoli NBRC 102217 TaxID=1219072 RepID=V5HH43_9VIBR|nr:MULTISPECIES: ribosomal protein S5-alanine N-acetyltransferase [Vibrio]MPW35682.1 30S ribosomal protein S5 alanine N-acetyltransferase [Vibrio sp. B1Z05]GAD88745.1 ribosomal-protein-alanine acetyltransferase RimJ [Vibrio halioticoli NBRC 102217]